MSQPKTHTGVIVTKDGKKTVKMRETATTWCVGQRETYDKFTGRRVGAPLTKRRLLLNTIRPVSQEAMDKVTALPVERDQNGYWTHPLYDDFYAGREVVSPDEFNTWLEVNGLEWKVSYRDDEEINPDVDGYDISTWQPEAPEGEGWFVGSIHDTEDGAVCIWLRQEAAQ